jgi:cobaltochelatase CobN
VHVLLQPERGASATREDDYHDLDRVPCHGYVAFHLWLRSLGLDALIHLGAHGTLEWLPGKAVALSGACWPEVLVGSLPVVYPFIVNDPGEAAQAKRRIGAVTIGHAPPPLVPAGKATGLDRLEALLDEFSNADGLDPARRDRLTGAICGEAQALGLAADLGLSPSHRRRNDHPHRPLRVRDQGKPVWRRASRLWPGRTGLAERTGLRAALAGRRVAPGPPARPIAGAAMSCPRAAISTRSTRARCPAAPPMRKA